MNPIMSSGLGGLEKSMAGMQKSAERIARAGASPESSSGPSSEGAATEAAPADSLTDALVDLKANALGARAATEVIARGNQTLGSLLDVIV